MNPKVSVLMSVYAERDYVGESILSVRNQDFTDWEMIVVVDNPDPGIEEVVRAAAAGDVRIRLLLNPENLGLTRSLNRAAAEAKGMYLARLDADDVAKPGRLSAQVAFLDAHPEMGVVGTWAEVIDKDGRVMGAIRPETDPKKISSGLLFKNQLIHPSVMMRREVFEKAGRYDEAMRRSQDYELWLRMRHHAQLANLPEMGISYRRHDASITQSRNMQQRRDGLGMMRRYYQRHKSQLGSRDRLLILAFFAKQYYKMLRAFLK